jgi:hypothetical protein
MVVIGHTTMNWTNPIVVMSVFALSPEAQAALDEAVSRAAPDTLSSSFPAPAAASAESCGRFGFA